MAEGWEPFPRVSMITFLPWFDVLRKFAVTTLLETGIGVAVYETRATIETILHWTVANERTHTVLSTFAS